MTDHWRPLGGGLAARVRGRGPRVVFVHGFTQTGVSWEPIADQVAEAGFEVALVDLPGHGGSTGVRADLRRTADLLAASTGSATYVGYSLGGRVCLHLALMFPHVVERLALIGATPGIVDDDERAARRDADDRLAAHIAEVGIDAFLAEWMAQPLFDGLVAAPDELAARRGNTPAGLGSSLWLCGTGSQVPLWDRLHELNMAVLAMAGARDTKFWPIAEQMATMVAWGRAVAIADAGHAAHLQQPQLVTAALLDWIRLTP